MLTITLRNPNNARQMEGNHLIVASQETFELNLYDPNGIANGSVEISPALTDYGVSYNSATTAVVSVTQGIATLQNLSRYNFTITNTSPAGESTQGIDITVVSRYGVKRHSAHLWRIFNYSQVNTALVEIFNMSNNESVLLRTMPINSWFTYQLPDDGMYRIKFGSGSTAKYLYIVDTSIVDKVYTDLFRKIKCCSCSNSNSLEYWWRHLNGLRDALELEMGKLSVTPVFYDVSGFEVDLDQYLRVDEIRKKLYTLAANFLKSKCSTNCSC